MWAPYVEVVRERLLHAVLVFDKFHIVRHLLDAVDQVRRQEAQKLKLENPELLNKTRYIWLKNPWNLTENQRLRLSDLEKLNLKINRAYLLKEGFRKFWDYTYQAWAKKYLDQWFWWATHSRLKPMRDFAWMIRRHQDDILNYFKVRIDNGAVEAMNNKAKSISHRAYGYRTAETFKLHQGTGDRSRLCQRHGGSHSYRTSAGGHRDPFGRDLSPDFTGKFLAFFQNHLCFFERIRYYSL